LRKRAEGIVAKKLLLGDLVTKRLAGEPQPTQSNLAPRGRQREGNRLWAGGQPRGEGEGGIAVLRRCFLS
jgi:hypothetical protein